jgi:hypothetical protein
VAVDGSQMSDRAMTVAGACSGGLQERPLDDVLTCVLLPPASQPAPKPCIDHVQMAAAVLPLASAASASCCLSVWLTCACFGDVPISPSLRKSPRL